MPAGSRPGRRKCLTIRIDGEERALIDRAAAVRGLSRTEFVLSAAVRAAEEALLDRVVISVSAAAYREFLAKLDAKPKPNRRLRKALGKPAPWIET
jgi:uncharacterized protein (DUF1778 family)